MRALEVVASQVEKGGPPPGPSTDRTTIVLLVRGTDRSMVYNLILSYIVEGVGDKWTLHEDADVTSCREGRFRIIEDGGFLCVLRLYDCPLVCVLCVLSSI